MKVRRQWIFVAIAGNEASRGVMQDIPADKKSLAVCATHGLRYDPALGSGCVLCRKLQARHVPAAVSGRKHGPFLFAALALLVAGGFLFRALKNAREAVLLANEATARLHAPSKTAEIPILIPTTRAPHAPERDPYEGLPPDVAGSVTDATIGLYTAAANGAGIAVQRILAHGGNINEVFPADRTPLTVAIEHDHESLAVWMISKGADAKRNDPLLLALRHNMSRTIRPLLDQGADASYPGRNQYDDKPIQLAVDNGDVEAVDALGVHGAKLDVIDRDDHSLLGRACASRSRRNLPMLQWVIDHLPSRSELEKTPHLEGINERHHIAPLQLAANQFNSDSIRLMILNGARFRGPVNGQSTLLESIAETVRNPQGREVEQRDTIHMLIEMGVDAAATVKEMDANPIWNEFEPWAEEAFIRKSAAKPPAKTGLDFVDEGGNTHLHWAAALGEPALIKRLIERDMDVEHVSQGPGRLALTYDAGASPLQLAAAFGHADALDALLAAGAKATTLDTKGRSPKDVVCTKESARYGNDWTNEAKAARCARIQASLAAAH